MNNKDSDTPDGAGSVESDLEKQARDASEAITQKVEKAHEETEKQADEAGEFVKKEIRNFARQLAEDTLSGAPHDRQGQQRRGSESEKDSSARKSSKKAPGSQKKT